MLADRLARVGTAVRLNTDIRRYALEVLDAMGRPPLAADLGTLGVRTLEVGANPLRILVVGAGLAVSYGVEQRSDGLDGAVARLLAVRTGRGVVLDNRAVQHTRTADVRRQLGTAGTHTFRLVIWCPSFVEGLERLSLRAWRADLVRLVEDMQAAGGIPVLLTHMPVPSGLHPKALIARPWVHRINRMIASVAAGYPHVRDVPTEPFFPAEVGAPITDARYFERVAERIVPPSLTLLGFADVSAEAVRAAR